MAIIDDPSAYFQTKTYTGNGSARAITFDGNSDLQPDWVWIKKRSGGSATSHVVTDVVRGLNKQLFTNEAEAEESYTSVLTAFGSNGFSLSTAGLVNTDTNTYVAWNWKAGTSFTNDASATGIGTIDSTGSVNTTSGFSIVTYTGNATAGETVAHGLGSVPKIMIIKRVTGGATQWVVYHVGTGNTKACYLNTTTAPVTVTGFFNNTTPTSSVFTVGTDTACNGDGNGMIAYCFADTSMSKMGSYTGNGNANGTFVYTGFKPAFVMLKRTDTTGNWVMVDSKRDTFNVCDALLSADTSDGEYDIDAEDFLSNGFKMRDTHATRNASGGSYIYMAFAENPLVASNFVPTTAR